MSTDQQLKVTLDFLCVIVVVEKNLNLLLQHCKSQIFILMKNSQTQMRLSRHKVLQKMQAKLMTNSNVHQPMLTTLAKDRNKITLPTVIWKTMTPNSLMSLNCWQNTDNHCQSGKMTCQLRTCLTWSNTCVIRTNMFLGFPKRS